MEPISTAIMVAQGVKLALTGVKETASLAKETFHELEEMIGAGASLIMMGLPEAGWLLIIAEVLGIVEELV